MEWTGKIRLGSFTVIFLLITLLSGCAHRIGDFSVISSGTPQYALMDRATITKSVEGKDSRFWFLFIPFGGAPNLEEAVDRCLDAGGGDFIERVRLYETAWSILLFSYGSYTVIGDVGNSKNPKYEVLAPAPAYVPATPAATPVPPVKRRPTTAVQARPLAKEPAPADTVEEAPSESFEIQTEDLGGLFLDENQ